MNNNAKAAFLVANSHRSLIGKNLRQAILNAYDHACQYNGSNCNKVAVAVDHIIPLKPKPADIETIAELDLSAFKDTLDCLENFTVACKSCNSQKNNKIYSKRIIAPLLSVSKQISFALKLSTSIPSAKTQGIAFRPNMRCP